MKIECIKKISIFGCQPIGIDIAQVCAQRGYQVNLYEQNSALLKDVINSHIDSKCNKKIKNKVEKIFSRIKGTSKMNEAVEDADIIIETYPERLELKKEVFINAEKYAPEKTIFATNAIYLSITEIASAIKRKDKLIGMYWSYPPKKMKLVTLIKGMSTSDETYNLIELFSKKLGKVPITSKDSISKRALLRIKCVFLAEAMRCLEDGVMSIEDIDRICKLGLNLPLGPFEMIDFIGFDILKQIFENIYNSTGYPRFCPPPLLNKMISVGRIGMKSGKGFYDYTGVKKH